MNLEGKVLSWNPAAERLYGYTSIEMLDAPIHRLFPTELQPELGFILKEVRAGSAIEGLETIQLRKDGAPVETLLTVSPIRDSAGEVIGASTVARDLRRRRKLESLAFAGASPSPS
jgi:PAS domain S-box-containing protein